MQRSKQQALMFLLGAVLVGGVLGFSAERVILHVDKDRSWAARTAMYDGLGLSSSQRASMDSVIDEKNRRVDSLLKPVKPQIDSDTAFHPIDLQRAIQLAQRNAPIAVQARGQIRTANSSVRAAYAAFLPGVTITAGQSNQTGDRLGQSGNIVPFNPKHPWSYTTGIRSTLRLFDGGQRFYQISQSKADVGAAEANDVAQQFNVALQVKTQYYAILAARESEAAAATQLDQAVAQLQAAAARVRAGAATLSDSLRSVIQVGDARLALLTAQN